ncbi:MAG: hypothetical protein ACXWTU_01625 [Methylotenera sp.]
MLQPSDTPTLEISIWGLIQVYQGAVENTTFSPKFRQAFRLSFIKKEVDHSFYTSDRHEALRLMRLHGARFDEELEKLRNSNKPEHRVIPKVGILPPIPRKLCESLVQSEEISQTSDSTTLSVLFKLWVKERRKLKTLPRLKILNEFKSMSLKVGSITSEM